MPDILTTALANEKEIVNDLLERLSIPQLQALKIRETAKRYVEKLRNTKNSGVESFIQQYNLSTQEGVAIMCLAESLLRIPDKKTSQLLVADKLQHQNWLDHAHKNNALLINASAWGLALTDKLLNFRDSNSAISRLVNRVSEPAIMVALKSAVKHLSNEFILGANIENAMPKAKAYFNKGYNISFDILGESSRTNEQAEFYYQAYIKAIDDITQLTLKNEEIFAQPNISIKLTALHPRVELNQQSRLIEELLPKLEHIISLCMENNISISFDAEEANRLDIYLKIFELLIANPKFKGYNGIGAVVQAYQKRGLYVIQHLIELATTHQKRIPVRLVKGAYWDSEIKRAQELALEDYPVFTNKVFTDLSYLTCAQEMLNARSYIFPQFATHNAYTAAAIQQMAGDKNFEFQKLQGMGDILHQQLVAEGYKTRVYAPVGPHEALLAYLMRRLLENGANTSFVNLIGDKNISTEDLITSPIETATNLLSAAQYSKIPLPADIYGTYRTNSIGYDIGYSQHLQYLKEGLNDYFDKQYDINLEGQGKKIEFHSPLNYSLVKTTLHHHTAEEMKEMVDIATKGFTNWSTVPIARRADIIKQFAEKLYANYHEIIALLMTEGGKNIADSISEIKEAADFALYYSAEARRIMSSPTAMPGYTGESNHLSLHPKGIFVCISPWNFPLAIFCGQILAALVTGNAVIAKASENTSAIAHLAVQLLYQAGVPQEALQLIFASGKEVSKHVLSDSRIAGVAFTGSTQTAQQINLTLASRPNAPISTLIAETGGMNAMIVDSSALLEQACDSIIHSAFGSQGQRCSALRIAYIQEEIYDPLKDLLIGAMNELTIGDTRDFSNDLGSMISPAAAEDMKKHIDTMRSKNFNIISYTGTLPIGKCYFAPHIIEVNHINDMQQENFGPILHLVSYKVVSLPQVIAEINASGYGLTFGIQSRINRRIEEISSQIHASNIYANRTMIGAQVGTHPFGGEGKSGTGFKAGGPHYLLRFCIERLVTNNLTAIGGNIELLRH